jgi:two-component system CheB/CheR fusion protein
LRQVLPGAFRKAFQSSEPVIERNIKVDTNGGNHLIDVTVQCIENPVSLRGMVMVVFTDVIDAVEQGNLNAKTARPASNWQKKEFELELQRNYQDIRSLREEMQTSQEELKSTIEELQSTNEELQSTNEELTTSKEEMQSMNEELQTLNAELQSKVSDYARSGDDMKNLLNSTEIATLFLDRNLNIRRFTDQVVKVFKLRIADIGRPFTDLVTDLVYPEIENHAREVLKTLSFKEGAIPTHDNRWFNVRIMPYRTLDDRIDGLVITFFDITDFKKLEIELKEANEELRRSKGNR